MKKFKVFYSWQSDLPETRKRIRKAIDAACANIEDCVVEEATSNRTGSPNIVSSLYEHIDEADLFIADVTPIYSFIKEVKRIGEDGEQIETIEKKSPNPNVLVEMGYAAKTLSWDRIICVIDGSADDLPFDIAQNRVTRLNNDLVAIIAENICILRGMPPRPKPNSTIEEKFIAYLYDVENWTSIDGQQSFYYTRDPSFRIETESDERDGYEYYMFSQADSHPHWCMINLLYAGNKVEETLGVGLDGSRFFTCIPNAVRLNGEFIYSYTNGTLQYALYQFFRHWATEGLSVTQYEEVILFFDSKEEKSEFTEYVRTHEMAIVKRDYHIKGPLQNGEDPTYHDRLYGLALNYKRMLKELRVDKKSSPSTSRCFSTKNPAHEK